MTATAPRGIGARKEFPMALQSLIRFLIPREDRFYTLLEQHAICAHEAACALSGLAPGANAEAVFEKVDEYEHQGDKLFHDLEEALAQTFVTPIDREDIHRLASRLDDILDLTKLTAQTYVLYGIKEPTPAMTRQMELLCEATRLLRDTLPSLRKHAYNDVIKANRAIFQIEKDGDGVFRKAVGALFHDNAIDAKELLRAKEVLEDLEQAINHCEHAADVLSNVAVKHG